MDYGPVCTDPLINYRQFYRGWYPLQFYRLGPSAYNSIGHFTLFIAACKIRIYFFQRRIGGCEASGSAAEADLGVRQLIDEPWCPPTLF